MTGIELGHHGLQDLVTNGGQNLLVKVLAQLLVDLGQVIGVRPAEDSEGDVHHLEILGAGGGGDLARPGSDIVDNRVLEPGQFKMQTLRQSVVLNASDPVEHDGPVTSVHREHGVLQSVVSSNSSSQQLHANPHTLGSLTHPSC